MRIKLTPAQADAAQLWIIETYYRAAPSAALMRKGWSAPGVLTIDDEEARFISGMLLEDLAPHGYDTYTPGERRSVRALANKLKVS